MEKFFRAPIARGHCEACALPLGGKAYRLPKLAGLFCSIACAETKEFLEDHIAAGAGRPWRNPTRQSTPDYAQRIARRITACTLLGMARPNSDRESVSCSGFNTHSPRSIAKSQESCPWQGIYCQNPRCRRGDDGQPAKIAIYGPERSTVRNRARSNPREDLYTKIKGEKPRF